PEDLAYQATRLIPREKNARSQTVTLRHVEGACGVSPRPGNATSPRSMRSAPPNGGTEPRVPGQGRTPGQSGIRNSGRHLAACPLLCEAVRVSQRAMLPRDVHPESPRMDRQHALHGALVWAVLVLCG